MISYKIIKREPPPPPSRYTPPNAVPRTQEGLDEFIKNKGYSIGDILVWSHGPDKAMTRDFHVICAINRDFEQVNKTWTHYQASPDAFLLVGLGAYVNSFIHNANPWVRSDSAVQMRHITDVEREQIDDKLQDYIKKILAEYHRD